MNERTLKDITQLHYAFEHYRNNDGVSYCFRGQANKDWPLIPKAGRSDCFLPNNGDLHRFREWESQAIAYSNLPESSIEKLAIAQHHGLATRLLDWTKNPLVATYFSVNSLNDSDGAVYIYELPEIVTNPDAAFDIFQQNQSVICYTPRAISPRVINQRGLFTIHAPANKKIDPISSRLDSNKSNLTKLVIPKSFKTEIAKMLDHYGIGESTLFPDLDGLSRYKNWQTTEIVNKKSIS